MSKIESFEDLIVWQKAHNPVLEVYAVTKAFPKKEVFGLTSQMHWAAVSVAANIAEGFKKSGVRNISNMYNIAQGSLEEVRYYFILAEDLGYLKKPDNLSQVEEVSRLLNGLRNALEKFPA